jgi:retron-type reverse transcriptase
MAKIMQRVGNLKTHFISFENLFLAWIKAFRATKTNEAYEYSYYLERNLFSLQEQLYSGKYKPSDYRYFTINDPKERVISVASFRDRIVHHALINTLEPVFEKQFIYHSYATRKEKGTHRAIKQAQKNMRKNFWYLKMDISKYFDSIDHDILRHLLSRKIKDRYILDLCKIIISKGGDGKRGLPIGNLTSQFWANVYLNPFDHFVKDKKRIKSYLRYMDDFCLFHNSKDYLKSTEASLLFFLKNKLKLNPKSKATLLNNRIHGLPFLGVRIFPSHVRIKRNNLKRILNKLELREYEIRNGKIDYDRYTASVTSCISHLKYWNCKELLKNEMVKL